jgi:hypothetical protein
MMRAMPAWALGAITAVGLVAGAGAAAHADDRRVHTSATVEVIDDTAQIDDVISRLRARQAAEKLQPPAALPRADALKRERPAPPSSSPDSSHRAVGPEAKDQRPGSRRAYKEHGNPDHTEHPKLKLLRR